MIARPAAAWVTAGILALAALAIVPQAGQRSLLPDLRDRNLLVQLQTVPGTSLPEMDRITAAESRELRALPGVARVGAHVGRAVSSDQLVNVNSAEVWVTLDSSADYGRAKAAIQDVIHGYPGVQASLITYPGARIAQLTSADSSDLKVRVYGADLATLQAKARQVRALLEHVPGVADPAVRPVPRQPTVNIEVNLAAAQRYGLRPGDVRREATTLTSGLIVGNLYEQSKIFDVVVWGAPAARSDLTALGNLLIGTPSGRRVALKDVASVAIRPEPAAITHDDVLRDVEVVAKVTGDPAATCIARFEHPDRLMPLSCTVSTVGDVDGRSAASRHRQRHRPASEPPVVSVAAQDAGDHFGWLAGFASFDNPASSTLTQKQLG